MIRSYQLGKFLKFNLAGQTALQVDGAWASQTQIIQGFYKFAPPHMIVRADSLEEDLKLLTQQVGLSWQNPPPATRIPTAKPGPLGNL